MTPSDPTFHSALRPLSRRTVVASPALALLTGAGLAAAAPAYADHGGGSGGGGDATGDKAPIFDFGDAFYRANGIDPAGLVGRRNGSDGISVPDTAPDSDHRDVRVTFTLPAYDTSGTHWFFTVLADLAPTAFLTGSAGKAAKRLADASTVWVFPTRDGDPLGVGNSRQADMIDLSGGYFSNNPLGLWVHVFVTWTPKALNTPAGQRALAALAARNGTALDGTPIIRTRSDLDSLARQKYVAQTRRPADATGRYFVCPVYKDPRDGAIAPDAFLATVRRSDGTPLPAEQSFVTEFDSLRQTGDWPH